MLDSRHVVEQDELIYFYQFTEIKSFKYLNEGIKFNALSVRNSLI